MWANFITIMKFILLTALGIGIGGLAVYTASTVYGSRFGLTDAPPPKAAFLIKDLQQQQTMHNGIRRLKIEAVVINAGDAIGSLVRATFNIIDSNGQTILSWPSAIPSSAIAPDEQFTLSAKIVKPPSDMAKVTLVLGDTITAD